MAAPRCGDGDACCGPRNERAGRDSATCVDTTARLTLQDGLGGKNEASVKKWLSNACFAIGAFKSGHLCCAALTRGSGRRQQRTGRCFMSCRQSMAGGSGVMCVVTK